MARNCLNFPVLKEAQEFKALVNELKEIANFKTDSVAELQTYSMLDMYIRYYKLKGEVQDIIPKTKEQLDVFRWFAANMMSPVSNEPKMNISSKEDIRNNYNSLREAFQGTELEEALDYIMYVFDDVVKDIERSEEGKYKDRQDIILNYGKKYVAWLKRQRKDKKGNIVGPRLDEQTVEYEDPESDRILTTKYNFEYTTGFIRVMRRVFYQIDALSRDTKRIKRSIDLYNANTEEESEKIKDVDAVVANRKRILETIVNHKERLLAIMAPRFMESEGIIIDAKNNAVALSNATLNEYRQMLENFESQMIDEDDVHMDVTKGDRYVDPRTISLMDSLTPQVKRALSEINRVQMNVKGQPKLVRSELLGTPLKISARTAMLTLQRLLVNVESKDMMAVLQAATADNPWLIGFVNKLVKHPDMQAPVFCAAKKCEATYLHTRYTRGRYKSEIQNARFRSNFLSREARNNATRGTQLGGVKIDGVSSPITATLYKPNGFLANKDDIGISLTLFDAIDNFFGDKRFVANMYSMGSDTSISKMFETKLRNFRNHLEKTNNTHFEEYSKVIDEILDEAETLSSTELVNKLIDAIAEYDKHVFANMAALLRGAGVNITVDQVIIAIKQPISNRTLAYIEGNSANIDEDTKTEKNRFYLLFSHLKALYSEAFELSNNDLDPETKTEKSLDADISDSLSKKTTFYLYNTRYEDINALCKLVGPAFVNELEGRTLFGSVQLNTYVNNNLLHSVVSKLNNSDCKSVEEYLDRLYNEFIKYEGMAFTSTDTESSDFFKENEGWNINELTGWLKWFASAIVKNEKTGNYQLNTAKIAGFKVYDGLGFNNVEYGKMSKAQHFSSALAMYFSKIYGVNDDLNLIEFPIQADYTSAYNFLTCPHYAVELGGGNPEVVPSEFSASMRSKIEAHVEKLKKAKEDETKVKVEAFRKKIHQAVQNHINEAGVREALQDAAETGIISDSLLIADSEKYASEKYDGFLFGKEQNYGLKGNVQALVYALNDVMYDKEGNSKAPKVDNDESYLYQLIYKLEEGTVVCCEAVEQMTNELLLEIERIKETNRRMDNADRIKLSTYENNRNTIFSFPILNHKKFNNKSFLERVEEIQEEEGVEAAQDFIREVVAEQLEDQIAADIAHAQELGVFKNKGMVFGSEDNRISFYDKDGNFENLDWKAKAKFRDFSVNNVVNKYQMTKIFFGGQAQMASLSDFEKRAMLTHAPHTMLYLEATWNGKRIWEDNDPMKGKQAVVYLRDNVVKSSLIEDIKEVLSRLVDSGRITENQFNKMISEYEKIKSTDGQGFRTLDSYRKIMISSSNGWSNEQEKAYIAIKNGTWTKEDLDVFIQEIKPIYTGYEEVQVDDESKPIRATVLHKYSETILLPLALADVSTKAASSPLRALTLAAERLEAEGQSVDLFLFDSDVKVGGFSSVDTFANENIQTVEEAAEDIVNYVLNAKGARHVLPLENYGIAASTKPHVKNERIAYSAQAINMAFANIMDKDQVTINGETLKAKEARDMFFKIQAYEINEAYKELTNMLGSTAKVAKLLREELLTKPYNSDELQYALQLVNNGTFAVQLFTPSVAHEVQMLLLSVIRKRMTKTATKGANIIQTTSLGMDISTKILSDSANKALAEEDRLTIQFEGEGKNKRLKYVEVFVPITDDRLTAFADENGVISPARLRELVAKGVIDESALEFVAYRTPSDAEHSIIPCRVKGFTSNANGSSIVMPCEIMNLTGHDYDGDKVRCHFKEFSIFEIDSNAEVSKAEQHNDVSEYNHILKTNRYDFFNPETASLSEATAAQRSTAKVEILFAQLTSVEGSARVLMTGGAGRTAELAMVMYVCKHANDSVTNRESVIEVLKDHFRKVDPNATEERLEQAAKGAAKHEALFDTINSLSYSELCSLFNMTRDSISPYSVSHANDAYEYMMAGVDLIGAYAMYSSAFQRIQRADIRYAPTKVDPEDSKKRVPREIQLFGVTISGKNHKNNKLCDIFERSAESAQDDEMANGYVANSLSELVHLSVDNGKFPGLGFLNQNSFTTDITAFLIGLGFRKEEIYILLNQPIIIEWVHRISSLNSRGEDAETAMLLDELKTALKASKDGLGLLEAKKGKSNIFVSLFYNSTLGQASGLAFLRNMNKNARLHPYRVSLNQAKKHLSMKYSDFGLYKENGEYRTNASKASIIQQAAVLQFFMFMKNDARDMSEFCKVIRPDSASGALDSTLDGVIAQVLRLENFTDKVSKKNGASFEGMYDVIKEIEPHDMESIYGNELPDVAAYNNLMMRQTLIMLRSYFPQAKDSFLDMIRYVASMYDYNRIDKTLVGRIVNELLQWCLLQNSDFVQKNDTGKKVRQSVKGKNRLAKEQYDIITQVPKRLYDFLAKVDKAMEDPTMEDYEIYKQFIDNAFLDHLTFNNPTEDKLPSIHFQMSGGAIEGEAAKIRRGWADMMIFGNAEINQLAIDLYKYNLFTSAFNYGAHEFGHFAPMNVILETPMYVEALREILDYDFNIIDLSDDLTSLEKKNENAANFVHQYLRNHARDRHLLDTLPYDNVAGAVTEKSTYEAIVININALGETKNDKEYAKGAIARKPYILVEFEDGEGGTFTELYRVNFGENNSIILTRTTELSRPVARKQSIVHYNPTLNHTLVNPLELGNVSEYGNLEAKAKRRKEKAKKTVVNKTVRAIKGSIAAIVNNASIHRDISRQNNVGQRKKASKFDYIVKKLANKEANNDRASRLGFSTTTGGAAVIDNIFNIAKHKFEGKAYTFLTALKKVLESFASNNIGDHHINYFSNSKDIKGKKTEISFLENYGGNIIALRDSVAEFLEEARKNNTVQYVITDEIDSQLDNDARTDFFNLMYLFIEESQKLDSSNRKGIPSNVHFPISWESHDIVTSKNLASEFIYRSVIYNEVAIYYENNKEAIDAILNSDENKGKPLAVSHDNDPIVNIARALAEVSGRDEYRTRLNYYTYARSVSNGKYYEVSTKAEKDSMPIEKGSAEYSALNATIKKGTTIMFPTGDKITVDTEKTIEDIYQKDIKKSKKGGAPSEKSFLFVPHASREHVDSTVYDTLPSGSRAKARIKAKDNGQPMTRAEVVNEVRMLYHEARNNKNKTIYLPADYFDVYTQNIASTEAKNKEIASILKEAGLIPVNVKFPSVWQTKTHLTYSNTELENLSYEYAYKILWMAWANQNKDKMDKLAENAAGKTLTDAFATGAVSQARALAEILNVEYGNKYFEEELEEELEEEVEEKAEVKEAKEYIDEEERQFGTPVSLAGEKVLDISENLALLDTISAQQKANKKGDKKSLNIIRVNPDNSVTTETVPATPGNIITARKQKAYMKLNEKLRAILADKGISVGVLEQIYGRITAGGVTIFDTPRVTAEGLIEMIRLAEGIEGEMSLPEEFAHVAIAMLGRNHPLVSRLITTLLENEGALREAFGEFYEAYLQEYEGDMVRMAEEAAGKLVAKQLLRKQEAQTSIIKRILTRVCDAIKAFFRMFSKNAIRNAIFDAEHDASTLANDIFNNKLIEELQLENISSSGQFLSILAESKRKQEDLSNKTDIISKLMKVEAQRLDILERRIGYEDKMSSPEYVATLNQLEKLKADMTNTKQEAVVIEYMQNTLSYLAKVELSLQRAIDLGQDVNVVSKQLNAIRDQIFGFFQVYDAINAAIASGELRDTDRLIATLEKSTLLLNQFFNKYRRLSTLYTMHGLTPIYGENGITVQAGNDKGRVISLREMATRADHDISFTSRWLNSLADCNDFILKAVDSIVRKAKMKARSRTRNIKARLEVAMANLQRATGSRDQSFMFEYTYEGGKKVKTGKYLSMEDAKNTLTPAQFEYYKEIMKIKKECDSCLPISVISDDNRKIVMLRKLTREKLTNSDMSTVDVFVDKVRNSLLDTSDDFDPTTQTIVKDFEGNIVDMLPIKFVTKGKHETFDDMTDDVATSILAYAGMATEYNELNNVVGIVENMKWTASEREIVQKSGNRTQMQRVNTQGVEFAQPYTKKGALSHAQRALEDFISMQLYGHMYKDEGTFGNTRVSKRKAGNMVIGIASLSQMALNLPQRISNISSGVLSIVLETIGTDSFSVSDILWATKEYMKHSGSRLSKVGRTERDDKLSLWMEYFDFHQDNGKKHTKYNGNTMSRIFNKNLLYSGLLIGEDYLAATVSLAKAKNIILKTAEGKTITLYDAMEVVYLDPAHKTGAKLQLKPGVTQMDGSKVTTDFLDQFATSVYNTNFKLQGIYNTDDRSSIHQVVVGAFLMVYRKWIAPAIMRRYGAAQYNTLKGDYEEGYYRTIYRLLRDSVYDAKEMVSEQEGAGFLSNMIRDIKAYFVAIKANWSKLTDYEKSNCKRAMSELGIVLGIYLASSLMLRCPPDEDEDGEFLTWLDQFALSQLLRLRANAGAVTPTPLMVDEVLRIIESPSAVIAPLQQTLNAFQLMLPWNWFTEIETGKYAGHTKAYKYLRDMPLINAINRVESIIDPQPTIYYYTTEFDD